MPYSDPTATSRERPSSTRNLNGIGSNHVYTDETLVLETTASFTMNRPLFIIPIIGCLVLAIAVSAPSVVADILGSRGGWRTAFDVVTEKPRCWGLPGFTYCRVDYRRTTAAGSDGDSLHSITLSPLPQYVRMLRSDLVSTHFTTATALDRLRERCLIEIGLLGLLAFLLWPLVVALFRASTPDEDPAARLAAAGWRVTPDEPDLCAERPTARSGNGRSFGRRH
jgi:hypothetical protein